MSANESIRIRGARQHNLRNLDVEIPRNRMTVVTGVSGSGKSSLAFDTLYAEGYRKYMESLSPKARQLLDQVDRPEVDFIEGLSPVIAIEQLTGQGTNPRSTVASISEVADFARVLWSVAGQPFCPKDGGRVSRRSIDDCLARIFEEPEGSRIQILAPRMEAKPSAIREELESLRHKGYTRVRIDGRIASLDDADIVDRGRKLQQLDLLIDRVVLRPDQRGRIADSLELAFGEGGDRAIILVQESKEAPMREVLLSQAHSCEICGEVYPAPSSRLFSWNNPDGACPECGGIGEILRFDENLLVPDPSVSVKKGALKPWRIGSKRMIIRRNALLRQLAEQLPFDPTVPWQDLDESVQQLIIHGSGDQEFLFKLGPGNRKPKSMPFPGVIPDLEDSFTTSTSDGLRARLIAYQRRLPCPACEGARLGAYPRSIRVEGVSYPEFLAMPVDTALKQAEGPFRASAGKLVDEAVEGLAHRLRFLEEVGLGYLTLDRSFQSLSGGEAQRARLATQLGMGLVGVIYVLDEPSIGLHPIDIRRLIQNLHRLRDRGNTVVVVEHEEAMIRAADHLVEMGPGAGSLGGNLVYAGQPGDIAGSPASRTGAYLSGKESLLDRRKVRSPGKDALEVLKAVEHNLDGFDVSFPVGCLSVVCGVSGSGKSSLVHDILAAAAARKLNRAKSVPGAHGGIRGLEHFDTVVEVDQSAIGRSPRSNPATFAGVFSILRSMFAKTPLAKVRGYAPGRFSFNVSGGRCERCKGDGVIRLDMQFMSDVYVECPSCQGRRYNRETLEVRYRGLNIAEVLDLTIEEARDALSKNPAVLAKLDLLREVGLGYLRLGQSATTLSGGEAQRLKLATELSRREQGRTLYLLDEPTTGLHWDDIGRLIDVLYRLRDAGNTILIIEHDLDLIRMADWVVELGPEGGEAGGHLLFSGTPEKWKSAGKTPTLEALRAQG
ncbi:excinuclease ABC subunit UvrA [Puniceicoccus vermicola]|uniref:UvrABC system protein A n=1 Tax=Puniceicoccus vermicola TaxID=388746 RepID=A0A7X1E5Y7_9BACT|nr:excinuclease ABC subunit UvrA [Puniceicoccus vermicola]MBC2603558.1 excinuclease ABC subunit UvrA [Puniceicoccus vermicola]